MRSLLKKLVIVVGGGLLGGGGALAIGVIWLEFGPTLGFGDGAGFVVLRATYAGWWIGLAAAAAAVVSRGRRAT